MAGSPRRLRSAGGGGLLSVERFGYISEDQTTGSLRRPLGGCECLQRTEQMKPSGRLRLRTDSRLSVLTNVCAGVLFHYVRGTAKSA